MERLKPSEAVERYRKKGWKSCKTYLRVDPEDKQVMEEMRCMMTGLIGAMLKLGLPSISSPQIKERVPAVVTNLPGDMLRIFIDPYLDAYGRETKKGREHVILTALTYKGEQIVFATEELTYGPHIALAQHLQHHQSLIDSTSKIFSVGTNPLMDTWGPESHP